MHKNANKCAFIPAYHIVILTAATRIATATQAATLAIATVAVPAAGYRLPIIMS